MPRISAFILVILGLTILVTGCGRPACKNTNPVFDKYAPETKEYKYELVKQLAKVDKSRLNYWLDTLQADNNSKYLLALIQGDGLCAKIALTINGSDKGIERIIQTKGMGCRGAELEGLKFDIGQASLSTEFVFQKIRRIADYKRPHNKRSVVIPLL